MRDGLCKIDCVAYRVTTYDVPFRVWPNRRNGRFNSAAGEPDAVVQYLAFDPAACLAEIVRYEGMRVPESRGLVQALWEVRVNADCILDCSTPDRANAADVDIEVLVADDHRPCQALGKRSRSEEVRGIVAPSAALPGSLTLALFGPRLAIDWDREPRIASQMRARRIAEVSPADHIVDSTRRFGQAFPADVRLDPLEDHNLIERRR